MFGAHKVLSSLEVAAKTLRSSAYGAPKSVAYSKAANVWLGLGLA